MMKVRPSKLLDWPLSKYLILGCSLLVIGYSSSEAAEPLPLTSSYWRDASFQKSFNGSYRIEARIEPSVSTEERGLLVEVQGLMEKGERKSALSKVKGSALTAKSAALKFNLGNLRFEEGELEESIKAYEEALKMYPSFRRAHRNLAMAQVRKGELKEALEHLMEHRTVLIIAHRLSTVRRADKIVVMEQGRVIESGDHDSLIAQQGHYANLWRHQSDLIPEYA